MGVKMTPPVVQDKLQKLGHLLFSKQKMVAILSSLKDYKSQKEAVPQQSV